MSLTLQSLSDIFKNILNNLYSGYFIHVNETNIQGPIPYDVQTYVKAEQMKTDTMPRIVYFDYVDYDDRCIVSCANLKFL